MKTIEITYMSNGHRFVDTIPKGTTAGNLARRIGIPLNCILPVNNDEERQRAYWHGKIIEHNPEPLLRQNEPLRDDGRYQLLGASKDRIEKILWS